MCCVFDGLQLANCIKSFFAIILSKERYSFRHKTNASIWQEATWTAPKKKIMICIGVKWNISSNPYDLAARFLPRCHQQVSIAERTTGANIHHVIVPYCAPAITWTAAAAPVATLFRTADLPELSSVPFARFRQRSMETQPSPRRWHFVIKAKAFRTKRIWNGRRTTWSAGVRFCVK